MFYIFWKGQDCSIWDNRIYTFPFLYLTLPYLIIDGWWSPCNPIHIPLTLSPLGFHWDSIHHPLNTIKITIVSITSHPFRPWKRMKGPPSQPMAACERHEDFDCIGPGFSSVFLQEPNGFGAKITKKIIENCWLHGMGSRCSWPQIMEFTSVAQFSTEVVVVFGMENGISFNGILMEFNGDHEP